MLSLLNMVINQAENSHSAKKQDDLFLVELIVELTLVIGYIAWSQWPII